jgi:hypothetical protein
MIWRNDWTQSENVAAKYPDKLKELQAAFLVEAKKYQVLPLDATDGIKQSPMEGVSMAYTFDKGQRECTFDAQDTVLRDAG